MSMPHAWTERLFTRLLARYGSAWINLWAGVDVQAMHEDWSRVLDGVPASMIAYGLDNLPDRPPNATQFRALCHQRPTTPLVALEAPPAQPERVEAALSSMFETKRAARGGMKEWAHRLRDRDLNQTGTGQRMTITQRNMWRTALQHQE